MSLDPKDLPRVPVSPTATEEHKVVTAFLNGEIGIEEYLQRMQEIHDRAIESGKKTGLYE